MNWQPISETAINDKVHSAWERMSTSQRKLWEAIRIAPEKWKLEPWGNDGGGFWVVGLIGTTAVWYNDIEHGFNRSRYTSHGQLDEYGCNQDQLEWTIQHIIDTIEKAENGK